MSTMHRQRAVRADLQGELCASCSLVSHDERLARNLAWMQSQLERQGEKRGHT